MAATSNNLTLKMHIKEGADDQSAATTDLAKRVSISGFSAALEQDNLRLRAKLSDFGAVSVES